MKPNILKELIEILMQQIGVEESQVTPESRLSEDLGADALDMVEVVMESEVRFDIVIPDDDAEKVRTVADCVALIERLREEGGKA